MLPVRLKRGLIWATVPATWCSFSVAVTVREVSEVNQLQALAQYRTVQTYRLLVKSLNPTADGCILKTSIHVELLQDDSMHHAFQIVPVHIISISSDLAKLISVITCWSKSLQWLLTVLSLISPLSNDCYRASTEPLPHYWHKPCWAACQASAMGIHSLYSILQSTTPS